MEAIIIDIEIVEPVLLELGVEGEMIVNPTPAPAFIKGETGNGIATVTRTSGTGAPGTTDTYTIAFTNGSTSTFTVVNGANGAPGNGITSVTRTSGTGAPGTTDTYTITFTNGSTSTFTVVNGTNGEQGIQGEKGDTGVILLDSHIGGSLSNSNQFARLRDVLIPANTLSDGDVIQINVLVFQSLTTVGKNARLHLTQNLSTALYSSNQIAISVQGITSNIHFSIIREFIYWQGSLQLLQSSVTQAVTDPIANGGVSTDELFPFDASVDNYISISAGSSAQNTYLKTLKRSLFKLIKA